MQMTVKKLNPKNVTADVTVTTNPNTPAFKAKVPLFLLAHLGKVDTVEVGLTVEL